MRSYRCYFLNLHSAIAAVELIEAATDAEAVARAETAFRENGVGFSGFEVWDRGRRLDSEAGDVSQQIRRWRMKAEEIRTTADSFNNNSSRQNLLSSAESYEVLANAAEARLRRQKDQKPEAG